LLKNLFCKLFKKIHFFKSLAGMNWSEFGPVHRRCLTGGLYPSKATGAQYLARPLLLQYIRRFYTRLMPGLIAVQIHQAGNPGARIQNPE